MELEELQFLVHRLVDRKKLELRLKPLEHPANLLLRRRFQPPQDLFTNR